jgi:hypothetical protein
MQPQKDYFDEEEKPPIRKTDWVIWLVGNDKYPIHVHYIQKKIVFPNEHKEISFRVNEHWLVHIKGLHPIGLIWKMNRPI